MIEKKLGKFSMKIEMRARFLLARYYHRDLFDMLQNLK
jgi:hypothetical protein